MSSVRVNNQSYPRSSANKVAVKKFCGVCKNAGLPESAYTGHFTKSVPGPKGIVICPTILANECSFCYERGHFKSACPKLAEKEKMQKRVIQEKPQYKKKSEQPNIPVSRGGFSALANSDSDSDTVDRTIGKKRKIEQPVKEAWPLLSGTQSVKVKPEKPTFAEIIAAPAPVKKEDTSRPNICGFTVLTKASDVSKPVTAPVYYERNEAEKAAYARLSKSWADSDSEDEDEDW